MTVWGINQSQHILEIAAHSLAGEIAATEGDFEVAIDQPERAEQVYRQDLLEFPENGWTFFGLSRRATDGQPQKVLNSSSCSKTGFFQF